MSPIIFLTLYLGLVSGRQPIELQTNAAVKSIDLILDGVAVQTLRERPWKTSVDFGAELLPRELVAVGYDANGQELGRASQIMNVPRPRAEIDIVVHADRAGRPAKAVINGRHLSNEPVRAAAMTLDDTPLALDRKYVADIPPVDLKRPHLLAAEVRFGDGAIARREVVFGGEFGESLPAQLTAIAVTRVGSSDAAPRNGCFTSHGVALRVRTIEKPQAELIVVRDPSPDEVAGALFWAAAGAGQDIPPRLRRLASLDVGTSMQLLSAVPQTTEAPGQPAAVLFPPSHSYDASQGGLYWLLTQVHLKGDGPRQWADAVAVAGLNAVSKGRRRAVLLVLGSEPDTSRYSPAVIRKYLATIGVPFFVWAPSNVPAGVAAAWAPVVDISTNDRFKKAADAIRDALEAQRIVWLAADALTSLRAEVKDGCGVRMVAR